MDVQNKVSKYTKDGWKEDLAQLNIGRSDHGCGYFENDAKIMVGRFIFKIFILNF